MNFFKRILSKRREKILQREALCKGLHAQLTDALSQINNLFNFSDEFIDYYQGETLYKQTHELISETETKKIKKLKRSASFSTLIATRKELYTKRDSLLQRIATHNDIVAQSRIDEGYRLVGEVEGLKLDRQQMACIVKEAHNHLVIAGAGTGKTTTIIGKIKFLINKGVCLPKDILVLSFTNASATEMSERINKEIGQQIEASTFHKLGLEIIKKSMGITPRITKVNLRAFIKERLEYLMEEKAYQDALVSYLLYHGTVQKTEFDFETEREYYEYLNHNPPTTLKKEVVKSYGEMDIANFLAQNKIEYIYEQPYEIDTRTKDYTQYEPDFYLPEHNIYIEYFSTNKNGEVPSYFLGRDGKSATQIYNESIEWKRKLHRDNNTIMVECFAYEKFSGELLTMLEQKLKDHGVKLEPIPALEIINEMNTQEHSIFDGFIELVETVINLLKNNKYNIPEFRDSIPSNSTDYRSIQLLLYLTEPIYNMYNQTLAANDEIDFNDMINFATDNVLQDKYLHDFKYVIVDEYQDISKGRFSLLHSMRTKRDYALFCVGDDWQSIYRFAGSDIGFILDFNRYWGPGEISMIETTYRFPQSLVDISGSFIMQNPNQVKKKIKGKGSDRSFPLGQISAYNDEYLADFTSSRLRDLPPKSTVFFLGRYSFDIGYFRKNPDYRTKFDKEFGFVQVEFLPRRDLQIYFLTAHRSKGLQADYVFIINNKSTKMGFPSKMQDAPIMKWLLEDSDDFPYSEERRLFYVALTRAKKKVILLTNDGKESEFVEELVMNYGDEIRRESFTCPLCGGYLVRKTGKYGEFIGCTNYKDKGCKYTRNLRTNKSTTAANNNPN